MTQSNTKISARLTLSVVAACLVSFCGLLTETAVNIAFPAIMKDFSVTTETVQWLTTGNLLLVAMVTPLSSFLQKRFKLKTLFCFSAIFFMFGSVLALFAPNFSVLLIARLIHGAATGVGVPVAFCIILEQIPFAKVGTFIGFGALVSAAAPALGPTYGGIINTTLGWRNIFSILIPVLIVTIVIGVLTIKESRKTEKTPIDIIGIILVMLTFFCLVYAFANIVKIMTNPILIIALFAVGIVSLVLFVKHCTKCEHPLIDVSIFKNLPFDMHMIAFFLINAVMLGASFLLPNYMQIVLGSASMVAGFLMLPGAALNAIMGPFSGAALDKIGPKIPIMTGSIIMAIGLLLLTIFGNVLSPVMVSGFYIVFGIGCGIAFGNTMTVGMMRLPVEKKSYGNTSFNTLMQFAGAVGTSIVAAFVAFAQTSSSPISYEAKTASGSTNGFIFLFILAVICAVTQGLGFYLHKKKSDK